MQTRTLHPKDVCAEVAPWELYAIETWGPFAVGKSGEPPRDNSLGSIAGARTPENAQMRVWLANAEGAHQASGSQPGLAWRPEWNGPGPFALPMNNRRSERVLLQIHLIVDAEIEPGKSAHLDAFSLVANAHGGLLEMNLKVSKGQKLLLSIPTARVQESATVVAVRGAEDGGYAVAFEFDNPAPQFWPVSFPPEDWNSVEAER